VPNTQAEKAPHPIVKWERPPYQDVHNPLADEVLISKSRLQETDLHKQHIAASNAPTQRTLQRVVFPLHRDAAKHA